MKAKLLFVAMFAGAALMAADPAANLVLKQDFEQGVDKFVKAPETAKINMKAAPAVIEGRTKGSKAVQFNNKAKDFSINGVKFPVPGNVSIWVKNVDRVQGSGAYRRFFGTTYSSKGYFGFQEYTGYALIFVHGFNKKNKNIFVKPLPLGQWNQVSVNFTDKHIDVYVNGVKTSSADLPESISNVTGNLVIGTSGIIMDSYELYNRVLTEDEIKALAK